MLVGATNLQAVCFVVLMAHELQKENSDTYMTWVALGVGMLFLIMGVGFAFVMDNLAESPQEKEDRCELVANEVSGRTAHGGGLFVDGSAVDYLVVRNSSIVDSVLSASLSGDGREVYRADWNSGFLWAYTNVYNSDYDLFETDGDETGESGNLSEDPLHADRSAESVNDWDLHLSADSPLVDAGDPSIEDVDGSRSDLGAYGGSEGGW